MVQGRIACSREGCKRVSRCRGLCDPHYNILRKRIRDGETTWEELVTRGECEPRDLTAKARWGGQAPTHYD